jgi:hypothetical protein
MDNFSQQINQKVWDVVYADIIKLYTEQNDSQAFYARVPEKRGRPPKQSTQSSTSTGIEKALLNVEKTQTVIPRREGLRSKKYSLNTMLNK